MINHRILPLTAAAAVLATAAGADILRLDLRQPKSPYTVQVLTRDGQPVEGVLALKSLQITEGGRARDLPLSSILSVHLGDPASPREATRITEDLTAVAGKDRAGRDAAVAELTDIGLPVMTPLLEAYKDTDLREPNPLYRLFARLIAGRADTPDRTQDLVRLADGELLRGEVAIPDLKLKVDGSERTVAAGEIRRLAVRRPEIRRVMDIDALRHCTQIEFLDTGVLLSPGSRLEETAKGYVRLDFDIDGWSSDPDGLKVPGPNYKTNLVDGFPFGALVGRVGPLGPRWMAGKKVEKSGLPAGRLYFAVNDNPHWQNNIGSFRIHLHISDAYDVGDPQ